MFSNVLAETSSSDLKNEQDTSKRQVNEMYSNMEYYYTQLEGMGIAIREPFGESTAEQFLASSKLFAQTLGKFASLSTESTKQNDESFFNANAQKYYKLIDKYNKLLLENISDIPKKELLSKNPEALSFSNFYNKKAEEVLKQIETQQKAHETSNQIAAKAAGASSEKCPKVGSDWLKGFTDLSMFNIITQLPCIIVGLVLSIIENVQAWILGLFSGSVYLVSHLENTGYKISDVWKIILQLVDYAVVAFLIFISFANILRIQIDTYAIKKTIPTLVLGVIAANLSWFVCKEISFFADTLIKWENGALLTLAGINPGKSLFENLFSQLFGSITIGASGTVLGAGALWAIIGISTPVGFMAVVLGVIIVMIPMAIFIILGFLFLVRLVVVDFLVIASPLAFIALAFPMTQKLFQQWWSQFTRWVFMAPLAYFLIAVGIFLGVKIGGNAEVSTITSGLAGILRYVMMGAAMYFAIKIPFMLGGGIMNAWGGLGAKFGKYLGRRAERQIGDWSQFGLRVGKRQLIKPMGGRYTPYTFYKGLVQRDQQLQQKHDVAGASTGQAVGDAYANLLGNTVSNWGEIKNIVGNKGLTIGERFAAVGKVAMPDLARGQYADMIKQNRDAGIKTALGSGDDKTLVSDLNNAINSGNANKAYEYLNACAFRGLSLDPGTQDKFFKNITSANEEKYAVWQSAVGLSNTRDAVNNYQTRSGWANEYGIDKFGKLQKRNSQSVYEDMATNLENNDKFLHGGQTRAIAMRLNNIKNKEEWGMQQEGNYLFLEKQADRGKLDDITSALFNSIKQKRSGFGATPAIQIATNNEWKTLLGEIEQGGDRGKVKIESHIKELEVALKTGKITEDATQAKLNLLHYLKNEEPELLKDLSVDSEKIGQAIGKFNYNPVMVARPRLEVEADDSWRKVASEQNKDMLSIFDNLPKNLEGNIELALNIKSNSNVLEGSLKDEAGRLNQKVKDIIQGSDLNKFKEIDLKARLKDNKVNVNTAEMRQQISKFKKITDSYEKLNRASEIARNAGGVVGKWRTLNQQAPKPNP